MFAIFFFFQKTIKTIVSSKTLTKTFPSRFACPVPAVLNPSRATTAMDLDGPVAATASVGKGDAALQRLRGADPGLFLSPSADLAATAREASQRIYSSLAPLSPAQPPPLPSLLAGPAFDAEQIWSQIELLTRPLLPHLRRQLRRLEQQPPWRPLATTRVETRAGAEEERSEEDEEGSELEGLEEEEGEGSDEEEEEITEEDEEELEGRGGNGVEDKFLKTKHLEEFLEQAEEEEYGRGAKRGEKKATKNYMEDDGDVEGMDEDEDEEDENEDDEDELNVRNL
jgi:U3 small nucleolar RNA-associated protein MPP10